MNPSLEGGSKLPGGSEMQGGSLKAGGGLKQQFMEEAIVYNDRWAEKRGTVSPPKSEKRTYFVCRSDGTTAEFRPVSIESFNRGASTRHPDAYKFRGLLRGKMPKKAPETRLACGGALQGMKSVNPCNVCMASLGRLELPTYGLGGRRSIH